MKWSEMSEWEQIQAVAVHVMKWSVDEYGTGWEMGDGRNFSIDTWLPNLDMSDAWEIVEKLSYEETTCSFELALHYKGYWAKFGDCSSGMCSTAPEAICKASLRYVGVRIE